MICNKSQMSRSVPIESKRKRIKTSDIKQDELTENIKNEDFIKNNQNMEQIILKDNKNYDELKKENMTLKNEREYLLKRIEELIKENNKNIGAVK